MIYTKTVLIQHIYPNTPGVALFDLTREHHQRYCDKYDLEYRCVIDDPAPELDNKYGNWAKVKLIQKAIKEGFEDVIWLDADTIIKDINTPLFLGCEYEKIGACWQRIPQFPQGHWNTGALYVHNCDRTKKFFDDWLAAYPPPNDGWLEQGIFNRMALKSDIVVTLSDRWNATLDVSMVPDAVVLGFHGQGNPQYRYDLMRDTMQRLFPDWKAHEAAQGEREVNEVQK